MKRKYDFLVGTGISLYVLVFSAISILKFRALEYHDFDLAHHAQTMFNIVHGSIYCSILGVDFLGNHAHFIMFLLAPLYAIFPSPVTLLILQTLSLALVAWPLYLIAKEQLSPQLGWLVVLMYLLYPQLAYANLFEFHPTVFAALFLAMMFYFLYRNNFFWYMVFAVLALFCQENIFLAVLMTGILAIFLKKPKRFILAPVILSVLWFLFSFCIAMPYFNKGQMQLISFYSHLGKNLFGVALSPLLHTANFASALLTKANFIFVLNLFMPLSFLPWLGFAYLLPMLPFVFQHALSQRFTEKLIQYHYAAEMLPFIFIAMIYGLKRLRQRIGLSDFFKLLMIVFSVFFAIYLGPLGYLAVNPAPLIKSRLDSEKIRLLNEIPAGAGVLATFEFLPRLADRKDLSSFHNIINGLYPYSTKPFVLSDSTDYALIDFRDPLTRWLIDSAGNKKAITASNIRSFVMGSGWGMVEAVDSTVLFKKGAKSSDPLLKILNKIPKGVKELRVAVTGSVELAGYQFKKDEASGRFSVVFYWRCRKATGEDIDFYLDFADKKGKVVNILPENICYGIYPTFAWKKGEIIAERRNMLVPGNLPRGTYTIKLGFLDNDKKVALMPYSGKAKAVDAMGRVDLGEVTVK